MSRYHQAPNFGVPPNTHPPHAGANSSNVNLNRQTANTNKYEKAPPVSRNLNYPIFWNDLSMYFVAKENCSNFFVIVFRLV